MRAREYILYLCKQLPKDEDFFKNLAVQQYSLERNGTAEVHAQKLTRLFKDPKQAFKWLVFFAEQTQLDHPLHDLCMHIKLKDNSLPHLAHFGEGNLKYLFSNLKALETLTTYHLRIILPEEIKQLKTISIKEKIHQFLEELEKIDAKEQGIDIDALVLQDKIYLDHIKKINKRFSRPVFEGAKELLELMKQSKNSDEWLPRLTLKSEEIGLAPGYYMSKLEDYDIRAPMIGNFLGCCQHITGMGKSCVIHAVTSEFGATYAIFKAKLDNEGKTLVQPLRDTPVLGSWAWVHEGQGIGFDSIESSKVNNTLKDEEIDVFYTEYAQRLLEKSPSEFTKIIVGAHGATPDEVGRGPLNVTDMRMLKPSLAGGEFYKGYRDSRAHRILASRRFPLYYGMHALNLKQSLTDLLQSHDADTYISLALNYKEQLKLYNLKAPVIPEFLHTIFSNPILDINATELIPYLGFYHSKLQHTLLYNLFTAFGGRVDLLERLKENLSAELCDTGSDSSSVLLAAIRNTKIPISFITKMLKAGADPNFGDVDGNSFAHYFFRFRKENEFDPEWVSHYKLDLNHQNDQGESAIFFTDFHDFKQEMFELYLSQGANPNLKNHKGNTFLNEAFFAKNALDSIPSAWIERYHFDLHQKDSEGVELIDLAFQSLAHVPSFKKGSLGEYFLNLYKEKILSSDSYEALYDFCKKYLRDPHSFAMPLEFLSTVWTDPLIALIDKFFEKGILPSEDLLQGESFFEALASSLLPIFQSRWFENFKDESAVNENEKRLRFQWYVQHMMKKDQDSAPINTAYYEQYGLYFKNFLSDHFSFYDAIFWFQDCFQTHLGIIASEQLILIKILLLQGTDPTFLIDHYYSAQRRLMPFQMTRHSYSMRSLQIIRESRLDEYCLAKKTVTPTFCLLRDSPSDDSENTKQTFKALCCHYFSSIQSIKQLNDGLDSLESTYMKVFHENRSIFREHLNQFFELKGACLVNDSTSYELMDSLRRKWFNNYGVFLPIDYSSKMPDVMKKFDELQKFSKKKLNISTLKKICQQGNYSDFFKLCDKYPLLRQAWENPHSDSTNVAAPITQRGMVYVYDAYSKGRKNSRSAHEKISMKL